MIFDSKVLVKANEYLKEHCHLLNHIGMSNGFEDCWIDTMSFNIDAINTNDSEVAECIVDINVECESSIDTYSVQLLPTLKETDIGPFLFGALFQKLIEG